MFVDFFSRCLNTEYSSKGVTVQVLNNDIDVICRRAMIVASNADSRARHAAICFLFCLLVFLSEGLILIQVNLQQIS